VSTRRVGDQGEEAALRYMSRLGYQVVERNYRTRRGEIDLVLSRGSELVFVEVKLRSGTSFGHPLEALSERQKGRVRAAAEEWLAARDTAFDTVRFDVIGILGRASDGEILHVEDAF
jgi:putative endonuclease